MSAIGILRQLCRPTPFPTIPAFPRQQNTNGLLSDAQRQPVHIGITAIIPPFCHDVNRHRETSRVPNRVLAAVRVSHSSPLLTCVGGLSRFFRVRL